MLQMLCKFVVFCTGFVLAASTAAAKEEKYVTAAGFLVSVLDGCCRQTEWDEGIKLKAWRKEVVNEVFFDELKQKERSGTAPTSFFEKASSLSLMIDYCEEKCDKDYICNAFEVQQFRPNEHERLNTVAKATLRRDIGEKMWTCKVRTVCTQLRHAHISILCVRAVFFFFPFFSFSLFFSLSLFLSFLFCFPSSSSSSSSALPSNCTLVAPHHPHSFHKLPAFTM